MSDGDRGKHIRPARKGRAVVRRTPHETDKAVSPARAVRRRRNFNFGAGGLHHSGFRGYRSVAGDELLRPDDPAQRAAQTQSNNAGSEPPAEG